MIVAGIWAKFSPAREKLTGTVRRFEMIRRKLAQEDVADFLPLGQSFQVA